MGDVCSEEAGVGRWRVELGRETPHPSLSPSHSLTPSIPGVGDQMDRKRGESDRKRAEEPLPLFAFVFLQIFLPVKAEPLKPIQVARTCTPTCTHTSEYARMESDSRMEKLQEKVTNSEEGKSAK